MLKCGTQPVVPYSGRSPRPHHPYYVFECSSATETTHKLAQPQERHALLTQCRLPSSSSSIAFRSSTVRQSSDSRNTGGSDIRAHRILLSSSTDTGRQALSSNGICIIMRYFCSRRVCSTPRQCSHREDKPRPALLRSTLHNRHRA